MSRISRNIRQTVKQGNLFPATVIDIHGPRATVRLSGNGAVYHNLAITGGPIFLGDIVHVDFTTTIPTIVAPSNLTSPAAQRWLYSLLYGGAGMGGYDGDPNPDDPPGGPGGPPAPNPNPNPEPGTPPDGPWTFRGVRWAFIEGKWNESSGLSNNTYPAYIDGGAAPVSGFAVNQTVPYYDGQSGEPDVSALTSGSRTTTLLMTSSNSNQIWVFSTENYIYGCGPSQNLKRYKKSDRTVDSFTPTHGIQLMVTNDDKIWSYNDSGGNISAYLETLGGSTTTLIEESMGDGWAFHLGECSLVYGGVQYLVWVWAFQDSNYDVVEVKIYFYNTNTTSLDSYTVKSFPDGVGCYNIDSTKCTVMPVPESGQVYLGMATDMSTTEEPYYWGYAWFVDTSGNVDETKMYGDWLTPQFLQGAYNQSDSSKIFALMYYYPSSDWHLGYYSSSTFAWTSLYTTPWIKHIIGKSITLAVDYPNGNVKNAATGSAIKTTNINCLANTTTFNPFLNRHSKNIDKDGYFYVLTADNTLTGYSITGQADRSIAMASSVNTLYKAYPVVHHEAITILTHLSGSPYTWRIYVVD